MSLVRIAIGKISKLSDIVCADTLADALPICLDTALGGLQAEAEGVWRQTIIKALRALE